MKADNDLISASLAGAFSPWDKIFIQQGNPSASAWESISLEILWISFLHGQKSILKEERTIFLYPSGEGCFVYFLSVDIEISERER
ncbi:hypothetical protein [uncultured Dialister sp.]|uniref:hypothetical protein n=1 Tax=uncultured Dialister sp. TaxID=278064 RepID=UPI0026081AAC|nr:hypothetical protein [uncultured Dialister sp.]